MSQVPQPPGDQDAPPAPAAAVARIGHSGEGADSVLRAMRQRRLESAQAPRLSETESAADPHPASSGK